MEISERVTKAQSYNKGTLWSAGSRDFFFDQSKSKEKQNHGLWKLHESIMKKKWCYVCRPQSLTSLSIHWTYCSALYYPFANLPYQTLLPTIATSFASWVNSTYAAYCLHISKKRITKPNWTRFESTASCNRVLMAGNYYIVIGSASSTLWRDLSFFLTSDIQIC